MDKDNPALDFNVCDYTGSELDASRLFMRDVKTHQKIEFGVIEDRYVVSGLNSGSQALYRVFDLKGQEFVNNGTDISDVASGNRSSIVSLSVPNYAESNSFKILSVSGERRLPTVEFKPKTG